MEKNKRNLVIGITSLLLVTLLLIGLTYAYYRTRIIGNENLDPSISVQSKKLEIKYSDGTATMNMEGKIEPGFNATKTFSVENTGDGVANFSIVLDNVTNTFTRLSDWTYTLTQNGVTEPIAEGTLSNTTMYLAVSTSIKAKTTNTYTLTINYAYLENVDQSTDMGKTLSFRVNITDGGNVWDNAAEGTFLYALKNNQPSGSDATTPGLEASTANEARLVAAADDDGVSLVYRGNVTNNYVNFSGMCWRIVRIDGNGNVKLVLENGGALCDEDKVIYYESGYDVSTNTISLSPLTFIPNQLGDFWTVSEEMSPGYGGVLAYQAFDMIFWNSSTSQSTNNFAHNTLFENSGFALILNAWLNGGTTIVGSRGEYTFTKKIDASKLVTAEWCNDRSLSSITYRDPENPESPDEYHFKAMERTTPYLKCDMTGINETQAQVFENKIGLLTRDELMLAGLTENNKAISYLNNYDGHRMNPEVYYCYSEDSIYYEGACMVEYGDGGAGDLDNPAYTQNFSLIPSIVIDKTVPVTGNGTKTNPFVIG